MDGISTACGENITDNSLVMRDIWQVDDVDGASNPKPLNSFAITRLLNRAWQAQKIRPKLQQGEKRHEFKQTHGFRKYFKTQAEQARIPSIKIEILMGHSLGVTDSYARFTEEEMLKDYLLGIDNLTVNQNLVTISKNFRKQQEYLQKSFKEMDERYTKEIENMRKEYAEYSKMSEKSELDLARGINMLDKELKHQRHLHQQLKNAFSLLVNEIGAEKVEEVGKSSQMFVKTVKEYIKNDPEFDIEKS